MIAPRLPTARARSRSGVGLPSGPGTVISAIRDIYCGILVPEHRQKSESHLDAEERSELMLLLRAHLARASPPRGPWRVEASPDLSLTRARR